MNRYTVTIQGEESEVDIAIIQTLLKCNPTWGRTKLSEELCCLWNWRTDTGQLKDMACRTLLLKLDRAGIIHLPPRKRPSNNGSRNKTLTDIPHDTTPIHGRLQKIAPVNILHVPQTSPELNLFKCLLAKYHYLGLRNTVGENIKYLVKDNRNRPLACLLFGSADWNCASRDDFIGWDRQVRRNNLGYLTNSTRFLVLPWVRVPYLASHVLARVAKRISVDWLSKYGHPIYLLETFVDRSRYQGTCYQAANWTLVGQTKGRTRNDRHNTIKTSIKDINPIRARIVKTMEELDHYKWAGHGVLLGNVNHEWQNCDYVLNYFARTEKAGISSYRQFICDGVSQGNRPELVGGGLLRSQGGSFAIRE